MPNVQSKQLFNLLNLCNTQQLPILLLGNSGTGKSQLVKKFLSQVPQSNLILETNFSVNFKSTWVQDIIESKVDKQKRGRGQYGPPLGCQVTFFIDDLNLPKKEHYHAQPVLELI